jgi:cyanophycin synthetase
MRRETPAHWYTFSLDPRVPAVDAALEAGGRACVLDRGWIVVRRGDGPSVRVVRADELPITLGGLSRHNIANALAATAACDALGFAIPDVGAALRAFAPDAAGNPGRLNLFARDGVHALVDFAHNEAGLRGLLEVARGVARGRVLVAVGTAGDRGDEIIRSLGEIAARAADDLVIAEKPHYLRGREIGEMNELLRAGMRAGGFDGEVDSLPSEVEALAELVSRAQSGDVVAVMTHAERGEVFDWLTREGFTPARPA